MANARKLLFFRYLATRGNFGTPLHCNLSIRSYSVKCQVSHINSRHLNKILGCNLNKSVLPCKKETVYASSASFSTDCKKFVEEKVEQSADKNTKLKRSAQLAKVFAKYGTTGVIFHTAISLTSLGICYTLVSNGIDVVALLQKFNLIGEATTNVKLAGGASTFVIAYACHKVFMPVRVFCTVTCTPLIVRKLNQFGLAKTPASKDV